MSEQEKNEQPEIEADDSYSNGRLFAEWVFKKCNQASSAVKDTVIPGMKKGVKIALWTFVIVAALSFVLEFIGIATENNSLVSLGRIAKAICSLIILSFLFVIAVAIKAVTRGKFSIHYFLRFAAHFFLFQLIIAFVIHISPMPITASSLLTLTFATCLFAMALAISHSFAITITVALLLGTFGSIYFQKYAKDFGDKVLQANEPKLLELHRGDLANGRVRFFLKGKPVVWYLLTPDNTYELFDCSGNHDLYQKKLSPVTPELARLLAKKEELVSPRNMKGASTLGGTSEASSPVTAQAQAPAPVQLPTDNRKEYAVIAVNDNFSQDRTVGEAMTDWLGRSRTVYAYDYVGDIATTAHGIDYVSRNKLAQVAKKVVYATYETRYDRTEDGIKVCSASVSVRVLDPDNGNVVNSLFREYSARSPDVSDGERIALGFALKAIENQFKKNM